MCALWEGGHLVYERGRTFSIREREGKRRRRRIGECTLCVKESCPGIVKTFLVSLMFQDLGGGGFLFC